MPTERGKTRTTVPRKLASSPRLVDIRRTVRGKIPKIPFDLIARSVMPASYELSIVVCGDKLARSINKKYRGKTYAANVLSFPLAKHEGEIFLNVRAAEREAKKYGVSVSARIALLFVHGLFHLKDLKHGDKMEAGECKVLKKFGYNQ